MPNRRQAIIWTNADPIHRHRYAALWGDELNSYHLSHDKHGSHNADYHLTWYVGWNEWLPTLYQFQTSKLNVFVPTKLTMLLHFTSTYMQQYIINTLRLLRMFCLEICVSWLIFNWRSFSTVHIMSQYCLRHPWAPSHYMSEWWPASLGHIRDIKPQWMNIYI